MQLVSRVLSKDRKATAEFVALHADGIYAYVRHRLIPRSDLVDDIVQDVFLSAWESLDRFQGTSPLRVWLLGIARHKVEDYYRCPTQIFSKFDKSLNFRSPCGTLVPCSPLPFRMPS